MISQELRYGKCIVHKIDNPYAKIQWSKLKRVQFQRQNAANSGKQAKNKKVKTNLIKSQRQSTPVDSIFKVFNSISNLSRSLTSTSNHLLTISSHTRNDVTIRIDLFVTK